MTDRIDVVVVGAGVVGLAVARALAQSGRDVIVIERHGRIGEETSSRNSGVMHAGIYYPRDSLKARLCVHGRDLLYAYCEARGVAHRRCGKLIVAQRGELAALMTLRDRAIANGVVSVRSLEAREVADLEPELHCEAALFSPDTGIVDVHELMTALHGDIEGAGGLVSLDTELLTARHEDGRWHLDLRSGAGACELHCNWLVNAGGLHAIALLGRVDGFPAAQVPALRLAKGSYFELRGPSPFQRLVYPMPEPGGLGVHATLDIAGRVRFGPDVEWVETIDYSVDMARATRFYTAIRRYWPALENGALAPAYAGVRPKLTAPGEGAADFWIEKAEAAGLPGIINLLGIESPGLTSSLAIGERVVAMIGRAGARGS